MVEHEAVGSVRIRTEPPVGEELEFENRPPLASMPPSPCESSSIDFSQITEKKKLRACRSREEMPACRTWPLIENQSVRVDHNPFGAIQAISENRRSKVLPIRFGLLENWISEMFTKSRAVLYVFSVRGRG